MEQDSKSKENELMNVISGTEPINEGYINTIDSSMLMNSGDIHKIL